MKKGIISLLLALVSVTAMWADNYDLKIGGKYVTTDNYTNITAAGGFSAVKSGAGTVTYDPATRTLTLSNAVIEAASGMAIEITMTTDDYTIVLAEGTTNTVTALGGNALRTRSELTIEGGGDVTFIASANGIHMNHRSNSDHTITTIRNCTVTAIGGNSGITGTMAGYGTLVIDHATVKATGSENGTMEDFGTLTLTDVEIVSPQGAEWNDSVKAVCLAGSNEPVKTEVVIKHPEPETVENELVLNSRYDLSGDGEFSVQDLTLLANALVGRVNIPVSNISLSYTSTSLIVGATRTLSATVTPSNVDYSQLAWTTSDRTVATVDANGVVTGIAPGTCTITASSLDGSNKSASCFLTVRLPVSSITLSASNLNLSDIGTYQLTATVLPETAYQAVTFSSTDSRIAKVSPSGLVTALKPGSCTIACWSQDGSNVRAYCYVTVYWLDKSGTIDGHDYVDLNLPSKTLWATCNVGASSPEEYGNYFAWGETAQKSDYSWNSYFDTSDGGTTFNIYNLEGGLTVLLPDHDAATQNWSSNWCMPSKAQMDELQYYATCTWTTLNGVHGCVFSNSGNSIFMPAAGFYTYDEATATTVLRFDDADGSYWTNGLSSRSDMVPCHSFNKNGLEQRVQALRRAGYSVRPVRK